MHLIWNPADVLDRGQSLNTILHANDILLQLNPVVQQDLL